MSMCPPPPPPPFFWFCFEASVSKKHRFFMLCVWCYRLQGENWAGSHIWQSKVRGSVLKRRHCSQFLSSVTVIYAEYLKDMHSSNFFSFKSIMFITPTHTKPLQIGTERLMWLIFILTIHSIWLCPKYNVKGSPVYLYIAIYCKVHCLPAYYKVQKDSLWLLPLCKTSTFDGVRNS